MKTILNRNLRREFKFSMGRFISIIILLGLGAFVLVGLKVTGADMRQSADRYYSQRNLADAQITAAAGISKADQNYIKQMAHVGKVEFSTYKDAVIKGGHDAIRLQAKTTSLSTSKATSGRLPTKDDEIALSTAEKSKYKIGDTFKIVNNDGTASISGLKNTSYKIVGFVNSSLYLQKDNLGATNAGTGELSTFGILDKQAFTSSTPTLAEISYNNVHGKAYSSGYEDQVQKNVDAAQKKLNDRADARTASLKSTLAASSKKLNQAEAKVKAQEVQAGVKLTSTENKLTAQAKQISAQTAKVNANGVTYEIQSRNDFDQGYYHFGENADRIDTLSNSFPIIFFAVAVLVTLTTMSRMAEQKRIELGTLRALGYSKHDAMKVFLLYGISAGVIGSVLGAFLGTKLLPVKIFDAYAANIPIPGFKTSVSVTWVAVSIIISVLVATLPAVVVAAKSLREVPATLMLPKPPKKGAKVLLERFPFIWNHFSFNYKVTVRNLARYKSRMFMTIIGVLGCTALLITGFGIRDSLNGLVDQQFKNIVHYDVIGVYNNAAGKSAINDYNQAVNDLKGVKSKTSVYYESMVVRPSGSETNQSVSMIVPKTTNGFSKYVSLINPSIQKNVDLGDDGVVVTQKLAKLAGVSKGDYLTVKTVTGDATKVKIGGIAKMYAGHDIFMSQAYYKKAFDTDFTTNAIMLKFNNRSSSNIDKLSSKLNQQKAALTTVQSDDAKTTINNILHGLNNLVLIITIAASALAFVVLFTLTNINVSERVRELSTIKVLGFYPFEVVMYVYRETFFLTIVGILVGYLGGGWLHSYIMQTIPPSNAMADMSLKLMNFGISGGLTLLFSIIVMAMMAQKISRIDMLEALKSVD